MGDDMLKSTAGFANPFATGVVDRKVGPDGEAIPDRVLKRRVKKREDDDQDEILWSEGGVTANA
jgi:hypothetical protein